jgi:hypothetical protein
MRVMEWNDSRARYPNLWHGGMPRHILAFERLASRLRLGDLIAVYHPASQRHPERSDRYIGLSRVSGLRAADDPGFAWIDLTTAHRFDPPMSLAEPPRRVFLCCDPGWPEPDVALFRRVFDEAVRAGWNPAEEDGEAPEPSVAATEPTPPAESRAAVTERSAAEGPPPPSPTGPARLFAGVDYSGDMRDPRQATWLSLVRLDEQRLRVVRLEATGRHGLQGYLRDPDTALMNAEAIGLDFPFGLPVPFAERLMGHPFDEDGWWGLAKTLERMTRPDYLVALQEFRDEHGELKRVTDEQANAFSPLHRVNPDLGPMTYHGIRMIAEDRSRYAVKPFESAQGRFLLEVYPGAFVRARGLTQGSAAEGDRRRRQAILDALAKSPYLPVDLGPPEAKACLERRDALDAVLAARQAAVAVLTREIDRSSEDLAPGSGDRVRLEGWIYGLSEPA